MTSTSKIARAVDLGFGFTKFSRSMTDKDLVVEAMSFPSFAAPAAGEDSVGEGNLSSLDHVTVSVDGDSYRVGPDALLAASGRAVRATSDGFFTSPQYLALYLGALSYMGFDKETTINAIGVGLPLTVFSDAKLRASIEARLGGEHQVPSIKRKGSTCKVIVAKVVLVPQVVGGLISLSARTNNTKNVMTADNLVIDVGYGTLMWMTSTGYKPHNARSGANMGGVSSVLKVVANQIDRRLATDPRFLIRLDDALRTGSPLLISGEPVDLEQYRNVMQSHMLSNLQAMEESIGDHRTIDNVFLCGGGAHLYLEALSQRLGGRPIIYDKEANPQFDNLVGYQILAERNV